MEVVSANGVDVAFERSGQGPPLVLLHGAEADRTMFAALAAHLAAAFTVIACDQRDTGGTRNPASPYDFGDLGDDVAALIQALGHDRAHVFGHSFGGVIAQAAALRHPERIDRLVLSSTFRLGVSPVPLNPTAFAAIAGLRRGLPETAPDIARHFYPPAFLALHPEVAALFAAVPRTPEQAARRAGVGAVAVDADLHAIRSPTLVLAGEDDALIPPDHTRGLATEIPGARFELLPGLGHIGPIQDPGAVARAVTAFLQRAP